MLQLLIAECWYPESDENEIRETLSRTGRAGSSIPAILNRLKAKEAPPTYVQRTSCMMTAGGLAVVACFIGRWID